jgi:hypothetical protein
MAGGTAARGARGVWTADVLSSDLGAAAATVAVAALYYLIGNTPLSLLLLAALAYLVWRRTDVAVALIPLAVPFYMLPKHMHLVRHLEFSLGETTILLCTAIVLAQQARSATARPASTSLWRHFVPSSSFERAAAAFLAAAALATIGARFHTVALREFREVIAEPLLFYWLILQRLRGARGATWLALSTVAAGVLLALLGLGQLLFRPQDLLVSLYAPGRPRVVAAVYGNENNLALFLDRAIPMALALLLLPGWLRALFPDAARAAVGQSRRPAGDPRAWRMLTRCWQAALGLASLLMLYVLYRTESRGGEITVAVCAGVLFAYWQRHRPWALAAGGAAVLIVAFLARHRIFDTLAGGHGLTDSARVSVWLSALRMLGDNPYAGVGPDNFLYYYSNDNACAPGHIAAWYYQQTAFGATPVNFERCISHPHNMFLDFWLSAGFLGFVAALALLALFVVSGLRAFRQGDEAWRGPLLAALMAMLAFAVHGQVDNSYFLPDLAVLFWMCFGVVALWQRDATDRGAAYREQAADVAPPIPHL